MTNVSYIIVKHNHDTGLVTYQKAREKPNETKSIMSSDDPTASSLTKISPEFHQKYRNVDITILDMSQHLVSEVAV